MKWGICTVHVWNSLETDFVSTDKDTGIVNPLLFLYHRLPASPLHFRLQEGRKGGREEEREGEGGRKGGRSKGGREGEKRRCYNQFREMAMAHTHTLTFMFIFSHLAFFFVSR